MASRRRGRGLWIAALLVLVVAGAGVGAYVWISSDDPSEDPFAAAPAAADGYAAAWQAGDLGSVTYADGVAGADVAARAQAITAELTSAENDHPATVTVVAVTPTEGDPATGTARFAVAWELAPGVTWSYEVEAPIVREQAGDDEDGQWRVRWSPALVEPELVEGDALVADRVNATRAAILGGDGLPLVSERAVVHVGIATPATGVATPTSAQLADTAARVAAAVGVDAAALQRRVAQAPPDRFVEVITLRRERYDELRPVIYPLPGTRFRDDTALLGPTPDFAERVLGRVGDATAEDIEQSGGTVVVGQQVGHGGLQEAYESRLAGTPGVTVSIQPDGAVVSSTTTSTTPEQNVAPIPTVVYQAAPVPGQDIQISLDPTVQIAADEAVAASPKPTALVAVRVSTGELLAVTSGGAGDDGLDRALDGRYPPGSTFKVVSTLALLDAGLTPTETVQCPATISVGGRTFVNADPHQVSVPFSTDFAESCNTAFVGLSERVTDAQLAAAGEALGLRDAYDLGLRNFGGDIPANDEAVGHAAAMIGQSKVLASPLGMAVVAASVANGTTVTPRLVLRPVPGAPDDGSDSAPSTTTMTSAAGAPSTTGTTLAPGVTTTTTPVAGAAIPAAATVSDLMRGVVTNGTATVLAGVPGLPVHAKTGTAEFGTADPPATHAWMIGFQGDVAFAVLVEDGGFGAAAAGPVAAAFLRSLN